MNYRHLYHAGNFADVVKHVTLMLLLQNFRKKDKPFAAIDVFAGIGLYDLNSEEAKKTLESESGVSRLRGKPAAAPSIVKEYLGLIENYEGLYPGSPIITSSMLRKDDRLIATELHPEDYATLKKNMRYMDNVHVHHMDAYNAIKAFCPPKEKCGLVIIDPAFEVKDEFSKIIESLKLLKKRFANGMVMIWYPIKDQKIINKFYKDYREVGYLESLLMEFAVDRIEGLNKCGIIVSNPPEIKHELGLSMNYIAKILKGRYYISLLN